MIPFTTPPKWPNPLAASRFASLIRSIPEGCKVALLGLPDDTGVRLNGGRPGASEGPVAFRTALSKYGVATPEGAAWPTVFDAGDVEPATGTSERALLETHSRIERATSAIVSAGMFPIAVGGGHDLTLPFAGSVLKHSARSDPSLTKEVVYFDAHLDVRENVGSGMPFRKLVEAHGVSALTIIGADEFANSAEHTAWFRSHGGTFADHPGHSSPKTIRTVSFDLDCLDSGFAPGVSALNPCGLSMATVDPMIRSLGADPTVRAFDIMELSPPHDIDGRTARIAVRLFLSFLRGFAERAL